MKKLKYLLNRFVLRKKYLIAKTGDKYFGIRFKIRTEDAVGREIYKKGVHERENTDFLINYLDIQESDVIIDVGANIGWFSVIFDKLSKGKARIYSFEPDDFNYSLLRYNLNLNNCHNVTSIKEGISDRIGNQKLYLYPYKNRGRNTLIENKDLESIMIKTITFDSFCKAENKIRLNASSKKSMGELRFG